MIQKTTLQFLKDLKINNNKPWFDKNRTAYELAKDDFLSLTHQLIKGIEKFDANIDKANLDPKKCISRLNRDIRFSTNKSPYKTNFFAMVNKGGKKSNFASYYFQMEPNNSFIGGGVYMPIPADLQKIRNEIDYNFEEWQNIISSKTFKRMYPKGIQSPETLLRQPKGFEASNPAIEFLKMKGYYTMHVLTDDVLQSKNVVKNILQYFEATKPLIDFLNRAL